MTSQTATRTATTRHAVLDRHPPHAVAVATVDHFTLGPGARADAAVGLEPGWSLFSLELDEPRAAVFVRTDESLDLTGPFIVNQQRDRAREVLVVPLEEFLELADGVAPPDELAFLFSTARCGSTLASRIMATLPGVLSLSEPDVFNNLVEARRRLDDDEAATLLRAATAVLCHGLGAAEADRVVIKPRSEPVLQEAVYAAAFPAARHAFLYRDVVGFSASITRFARRIVGDQPRGPIGDLLDGWNQLTANEPLATLGRVVDLERTDLGFHEITPTVWAMRIHAHLAARRRGDGHGRIEAIHYDDLVADREAETARLLAACGLDEAFAPRVLDVFNRDAHAGMAGANDVVVRDISADELAEVERQLPLLGVPTYETERL